MFFFFADPPVIKNVIHFNEPEVTTCLDHIRCGHVCFVLLISPNSSYHIIETRSSFPHHDSLYRFTIKGPRKKK